MGKIKPPYLLIVNLNENILRVKEVMGLISESFEDESGSEVFPKGNFAYHITPDVFLNQIQQVGLVPKSESKLSPHPERIYLFMNPEMDKEMTNVLWNATKKEIRDKINDYYVLQVDLTQLPNHKFYLDRDSSFSYVAIYTLQPVPSSAIKVIKKIPTSDLKQDPSPEEQNAIDDEFEKVMAQFRNTDVKENISRVKEVMGIISEEKSSLVHLISTFLDEMEHLDGICDVGVKLNDEGKIVLIATIKREAFIVFGAGQNVGEVRKYYTDKVSDYFGLPVKLSFELVPNCY